LGTTVANQNLIQEKIKRRLKRKDEIWEKWNTYRFLVGKPEGKSMLGRPRQRERGH
jgi:hypothetical protein